jgi:hypothetical protein
MGRGGMGVMFSCWIRLTGPVVTAERHAVEFQVDVLQNERQQLVQQMTTTNELFRLMLWVLYYVHFVT